MFTNSKKFLALLLATVLVVLSIPFGLASAATTPITLGGEDYTEGDTVLDVDFTSNQYSALPDGWSTTIGTGFSAWNGNQKLSTSVSSNGLEMASYNADGMVFLPIINPDNYMYEARLMVTGGNGSFGILDNVPADITNGAVRMIEYMNNGTYRYFNAYASGGTSAVTPNLSDIGLSAPATNTAIKLTVYSVDGMEYFYIDGVLAAEFRKTNYTQGANFRTGLYVCNTGIRVSRVTVKELVSGSGEPEEITELDGVKFKRGQALISENFVKNPVSALPAGWSIEKPTNYNSWNGNANISVSFGANGLVASCYNGDGMVFLPVISAENYVYEVNMTPTSGAATGSFGILDNVPADLTNGAVKMMSFLKDCPYGDVYYNQNKYSSGAADGTQHNHEYADIGLTAPVANTPMKFTVYALGSKDYLFINDVFAVSFEKANYTAGANFRTGIAMTGAALNVASVKVEELIIQHATQPGDSTVTVGSAGGVSYVTGEVLYSNDFDNETVGTLPAGWQVATSKDVGIGWNNGSGSATATVYDHNQYGRVLSFGTSGADGFASLPKISTRNYVYEVNAYINHGANSGAAIGLANNIWNSQNDEGGILNADGLMATSVYTNSSTNPHKMRIMGIGPREVVSSTGVANPQSGELTNLKLVSFNGYSYIYVNDGYVGCIAQRADDKANDWVGFYGCNGYLMITDVKISAIRKLEAGEVWSGGADANLSGSGTEAMPYEISTAEQLAGVLSGIAGKTEGKYYVLTNDLYLNDTAENWTENDPLLWYDSTSSEVFKGTIDGRGHMVKGLYYEEQPGDEGAVGLFPVVEGAVIQNIGLADSYINVTATGAEVVNVGGLVGSVITDGTVSGCYAAETVSVSSNADQVVLGGLIGGGDVSLIENCYFLGTLAYPAQPESLTCGAILGNGAADDKVITNCYAKGAKLVGDNHGASNTSAGNYSTVSGDAALVNVTVIAAADLIGQNALETMEELDFAGAYYWTTEGCPALRTFGLAVGDVTGDGIGSAADIAILQKYFLGAQECGLADFDANNTEDIRDLIRLKKIVAGSSQKKN